MEYKLADRDRVRFEGKVIRDTGTDCWHWRGGHFKKTGYAIFNVKCADGKWRPTVAHRVSFLIANGFLPPNDTDHDCRNRGCVNPAHLEATSRRINFLRGEHKTALAVAMDRCDYGHRFTEENTRVRTNGKRACLLCSRIYARLYARKERAGTVGHWTPEELQLLHEERQAAVVEEVV